MVHPEPETGMRTVRMKNAPGRTDKIKGSECKAGPGIPGTRPFRHRRCRLEHDVYKNGCIGELRDKGACKLTSLTSPGHSQPRAACDTLVPQGIKQHRKNRIFFFPNKWLCW